MSTQVKVSNAQRNHKGCYKVIAKNELGEDTATVSVPANAIDWSQLRFFNCFFTSYELSFN